VELLEREGALATLGEARGSAAQGHGRVVFLTGEAGIGKTSLVAHFLRELEPGSRVLSGTCDDLLIPRPFGSLRDLAGSVSAELEQALSAGAAPHDVQELVIAELELPPRPTVLVLEDVHWADDATFDLITVLGRRIAALPALLVLTFRAGEVPRSHPLYAAVGAIPAGSSVVLELAPLSQEAVASLAGDRADDVYEATGGNPFYVKELLALPREADVPPSVANAVLGRASRLESASRRLVELVSVVPSRVSTSLLDAVMPEWAAAAEEPERRQLLEVDPRYVRFRHELTRNAIRSSIPIAARRRLHGEILAALLESGADPTDVVHHAEAAGAGEVVAEYALVAARRAAALESNREAYSHYRRAGHFLERRPPAEQASVLEELAAAASVAGHIEDALPALEHAIALHRELGDPAAVGRCTRALSRAHWFAGDGVLARAKAVESIAILAPLGDSVELARAYSGVSQLAMLAEDDEHALGWGRRALALSTRLGDDATRVHALVNVACAMVQLDHREAPELLDAHAIAHAAGSREDATRALGNLAYTLMTWAQIEPAERHSRQALAYAEDYEVHAYVSYLATLRAWLRLRAGAWDEAEWATQREVERGIPVVQMLARTVLAELAVRRGDDDAGERLEEIAAQAERWGEPQRIVPTVELAVERALTGDAPLPTERLEELAESLPPRGGLRGRWAFRIAAWAAVAGLEVEVRLDEGATSPPYAAMAERDWGGAAEAFGDIGWSYDRALMLSLLDEEEALVEALELARSLGAAPLAARAAARLREQGLRVPAGARRRTRENAAGLTPRQLDVLRLVAEGLTNAEIAERLVVSPRTAEHHVAAVLTKLGATTRRDAARRATELRLVALPPASPRP
jgi:DNA-binding CsgD family transcriptional regulator/tetratricopeptide (TPR) repeat protein